MFKILFRIINIDHNLKLYGTKSLIMVRILNNDIKIILSKVEDNYGGSKQINDT